MKEMWDLYDRNRNMLERKAERGTKLSDDEYHLVSNAWIRNSEGKFLISQRVEWKAHPLMWECTGGSVLMNEDTYQGAIREVKEELPKAELVAITNGNKYHNIAISYFINGLIEDK